MNTPAAAPRWARGLWLALWLALGAALGWQLWPHQIARGCWLAEWPFEQGCEQSPSRNAAEPDPAALREHLQRNPGDGPGYAHLARALWQAQDPAAGALLPWARQIAPYHPQLLWVQAEAALQARDWPQLAQALATLLERGHGEARKPMAALMLEPQAQAAVLAQLRPGARWLEQALGAIDARVPTLQLEPYISAGRQMGLLAPETVLGLVDRLKREGAWLEAYAMWVTLRGKVPEGLYNPGFDQPALRRGFDWEWVRQGGSRQGARIAQVSASPQPGLMMELELTGRAALPQPLLSQAMVLPGTRYRFSGRYRAERVGAGEGLSWVLRCAGGGERWAQGPAMRDTDRRWAEFEFTATVPAACAGAVRLQLETTASGAARAGLTGVFHFDDFSVAAVAAGTPP